MEEGLSTISSPATEPPVSVLRKRTMISEPVRYDWQHMACVSKVTNVPPGTLPDINRFPGESLTGHTFIARIMMLRFECTLSVAGGFIWRWQPGCGQIILTNNAEESVMFIIKNALPLEKMRMLEIAHWMAGCEDVLNGYRAMIGLPLFPVHHYRNKQGILKAKPFRKKNADPVLMKEALIRKKESRKRHQKNRKGRKLRKEIDVDYDEIHAKAMRILQRDLAQGELE